MDTPDLALELPTGTGKTLPGLLIADWVRRVRSARVAYACPTVQLARQVSETAGERACRPSCWCDPTAIGPSLIRRGTRRQRPSRS